MPRLAQGVKAHGGFRGVDGDGIGTVHPDPRTSLDSAAVPFPVPLELVDELRQRLDMLHLIGLLLTACHRQGCAARRGCLDARRAVSRGRDVLGFDALADHDQSPFPFDVPTLAGCWEVVKATSHSMLSRISLTVSRLNRERATPRRCARRLRCHAERPMVRLQHSQ